MERLVFVLRAIVSAIGDRGGSCPLGCPVGVDVGVSLGSAIAPAGCGVADDAASPASVAGDPPAELHDVADATGSGPDGALLSSKSLH